MHLVKRFSVCLLVMATASALAQSRAMITVKPARSTDFETRHLRVLPNGDLVATSVNAITLIDEAYRVPANPSERLSALPAWVYSERYDITATASSEAQRSGLHDESKTKGAIGVFRQVLADRFRLKMEVESRTMPVYALVIATDGPKLKRAGPSDCVFDDVPDGCHSFVIGFGHPLNARAVDMDDLAHYLENWTDSPVVNKTALTGLYTIRTEGWRPMRLPPPPPGGAGTVDFSGLPTLDTVLGRLGLRLRRQDARVPIYTVEHIERPLTGQ